MRMFLILLVLVLSVASGVMIAYADTYLPIIRTEGATATATATPNLLATQVSDLIATLTALPTQGVATAMPTPNGLATQVAELQLTLTALLPTETPTPTSSPTVTPTPTDTLTPTVTPTATDTMTPTPDMQATVIAVLTAIAPTPGGTIP